MPPTTLGTFLSIAKSITAFSLDRFIVVTKRQAHDIFAAETHSLQQYITH